MTLGFAAGTPSQPRTTRRPIYGEQLTRKVGFIEGDGNRTWICDSTGKRVARTLRYKPHQAPQPSVSACGGTMVPVPFFD